MSASSSLAAICVAVAGILFLVGERRQAAKAFGAAVLVPCLGMLVCSTLNAIPRIPLWALLCALPFAVLFAIFAAIRVLQFVIASIYGHHVSVRITVHALLSTFRTIGRFLGLILSLPLRLFRRRQHMDDLLRDWRRG
jgi:hypothetical protein